MVVVANDATVKAGAWFPMTAKKVLRAQEIALENRLPIVYLVDSAGVFLPLQDEIFPDREHFGRAFYNNARLSAEGIFQMAAIMGSCVAGGAYLPIMSDESHIVEGTGSIFLAGSHLVQAAIGEKIDNEELGGALVQCDISGVVDHRHPDDASCLAKIRSQFAQLAAAPPSAVRAPRAGRAALSGRGPLRADADRPLAPLRHPRDAGPAARRQRARRVQGRRTAGRWSAAPAGSRGTRWASWPTSARWCRRRPAPAPRTASSRSAASSTRTRRPRRRASSSCATRRRSPSCSSRTSPASWSGSRAERGGIIKDGAKMVNAVANSTVPKITLFVGNSYGAGNYAMCGKAYGARFLYAWPSASIAVMGGDQASKTLLSIQLKNRGAEVSEEEKTQRLEEIKARYAATADPRYAAARLWVDAIIDPAATRQVIGRSLACAAMNPEIPEFRTGVLQT